MGRLRIFVSSRTKELHDERVMIKKAFGHELYDVFVFEDDAGARTEPVSHVYKEKVAECHIYIGLFKQEYSKPTEEEYDLAWDTGKEILIYRNDYQGGARDPKLDLLFGKFSGRHTFKGYDNVIQLKGFIEKDVTDWLIRGRLGKNIPQQKALAEQGSQDTPVLEYDKIVAKRNTVPQGDKSIENFEYFLRVVKRYGTGTARKCQGFIDLKGTEIQHFPCVWRLNGLDTVDIGVEEDLRLFQVFGYGERSEISFWSTSGYSRDFECSDNTLNRSLIVKTQSENAKTPSEPFTMSIREILRATQDVIVEYDRGVVPILALLRIQQSKSDSSPSDSRKEPSASDYNVIDGLLRKFIINQDITDLYRAAKIAKSVDAAGSDQYTKEIMMQIQRALKARQNMMTYWLVDNLLSMRPAINEISFDLYPLLCNLVSITLDDFITLSDRDVKLLVALNDVSRGLTSRETFLNMCKSCFLPFSALEPQAAIELRSPSPMVSNSKENEE